MIKLRQKPKFAKSVAKLKTLKRTVSSPFEVIRKMEFKRNRLNNIKTLKYSSKRKMSYPHKFTDYVQWTLNLKKISERHGVNYRELIQNVVQRANSEKRKAIIIEFGPGKGAAIDQASKEVRGKAKFFGFGDCADNAWVGHKKVNYIQATAEEFRNYFLKNSVDALFSHMGLAHATNFDLTLKEILPCLRTGGVLKTDVFTETKSRFKEKNQKKQIFRLNELVFEVTNTPYYFLNKKSNDIGRVLTFTRIK